MLHVWQAYLYAHGPQFPQRPTLFSLSIRFNLPIQPNNNLVATLYELPAQITA